MHKAVTQVLVEQSNLLMNSFSSRWHTSVEIEILLKTHDHEYNAKQKNMLNGKFYTGLPPKMINRNHNNNPVKDHQQSNFFWPDDTDTESAVETRVRRRASLSLTPSNRPPLMQKRSPTLSTADESDEVDTKKMLHKEFAKSSIQFYDADEDINPRTQRRGKQQEITQKPTATKLELPNSETDTAAIKKKHVYDSKVEFYDYINEDGPRVKIDMNDKRDLERNTKNSPKLQNKNTVNNYMQLNTQISQNTRDNMFQEDYKIPKNRFNRAASEFPQDRSYKLNDDYDNKAVEEEEEVDMLRKSRAKSLDPKRRNNIYRRDQTPKRIIKPVLRNGVDYSDYPECRDDFLNDSADSLSETMTNVQINSRRPPARKRVTYSEEEEEIPVHNYYSNKINDNEDDLYNRKLSNNSKYSEANAHSARYKAANNRRPPLERSYSTDGDHTDIDQQQQNQRPLNNNNKSNRTVNNLINSNNHNKNNNNEAQENLPKMSTTSKVRANNWSMSTENKLNNEKQQAVTNSAHNHLRSSLCFYNGEIVASDNEAATSAPRARNAATKRVSVGLPD